MASTLIKNIKLLAGIREDNLLLRGRQLAKLGTIENAFLIVQDGLIAAYGRMEDFVYRNSDFSRQVDAMGQTVLPAWCDSHTHIVFADTREDEFIDKIKGLSYADIAAKGGGILNSAKKLNACPENELFNLACVRLDEVSKQGTGAIEIKSGYGLTTEGELKMLRVIKRLKERSHVSIKATFLAAHAYPVEYRDNHQAYIDLIINEMLPVIAHEKLADYIDVFCETGFFSPAEMEQVCNAGNHYGLKPKLHVNQLNSIGGVQAGIKLNAVSLDHLETMTDDDIKAVAEGSDPSRDITNPVIGTLLPTAAF